MSIIVDIWRLKFKIDLQEVRWDDTDWIELAQDMDRWRALVNVVIIPSFP